jgi:putative transposase
MAQNTPFIAADRRDRLSMTERCARSGVSRTTGDTWVERALIHGPQGLAARSRTPSPSPRHTPDAVVAASLDARPRPPSWGAKPWVSIRRTRAPRWPWPARSTVWDRLRRHGVVPKTRQRRAIGPPGNPLSAMGAPTEGGSADGTGPCTTGDGRDGSPLTLPEGYRRVRLRGHARSSTRVAAATPGCTRVCNAFGLPTRRRPDHGGPCATHTRARRSQWSACGVRLGRFPACIAPGQPPPHGRHARMPRTLNADPTRPPGAPLGAHQRQWHRGRDACPHARPHEALARRPPAAGDAPSPRPMPHTQPPLASPDRVAVRSVSANGGSRWNSPGDHVSIPWAGASVGLEAIDAGVWQVSCGPLTRGRRLEHHRRSEEADGRLTRHR